MVDFSRLKVPTAEERARDREEDQRRLYAEDDRARDAGSKKALTITLVHEPEMRTKPNGERIMMLRGTEAGRSNPTSAVYTVPPRVENGEKDGESFDRTMRDLGGGDKVSLAGQWAKRSWKDQRGEVQSSWEFKTQHFAQGEMSLERILEKARADRGETVEPAPTQDKSVERGVRPSPADVNRNNGGMGV